MHLENNKKRYTYRQILPIFGAVLLCLLGATIGIAKAQITRAASPVSLSSSQVNVPTTIQSIRMITQSVGWATANTTTILHTVTGDTHWINVTPHYSVAKPQSFVTTFRDAQHGWIAYEPTIGNDTFTILRTTNGGASWQSSTVSTVAGAGIAALTFNGNLNGWLLVGNNGGPGAGSESFALFSTTNGGQSWTSLPDIYTSDQNVSISFVDAKDGYLTHGGPYSTPDLSVTHNGGHSWQDIHLPAVKGTSVEGTIATTPPVFFGATGYLPVGVQSITSGFEIYTSQDYGATWHTHGAFVTLGDSNVGLGGVGDLYIIDPTHFYVTNQHGETIVSTNQGTRWYTLPGTVGAGTTSLSFPDTLHGWAAGNGLFRTNDGGISWQKVNYTVQ
jgi:hypothetical protein